MSDLPDWIAVGAKVAVRDRSGWQNTITIRTVERLTPTQVVVDGGIRFRRDNLSSVGDRRAELLPPTDRAVVDALAKRRVDALRYKLDQLLGGFAGSAAQALTLVDEAAALITRTRAGLERFPQNEED